MAAVTGGTVPGGRPSEETLLDVQTLSTGYGDLRAVWDVSLQAMAGQVTLVLGRNGAGKTTTLMSIAGLLPVFAGSVRYCGELIDHRSVRDRVKAGISFVPEGKRIFPSLSVEQNLAAGGVFLDKAARKANAEAVFERFPMLAKFRTRKAGSLSGGQQQCLAIGQALMGRPRLLILDEPSAGLAPMIYQDVLAALVQLADEGVGILLVEQLIDITLPIADRLVLIDRGRTVYSSESPMQDSSRDYVHAHLGAEFDDGRAVGQQRD
ncbi:MAG: ABC-type branched-chain amino acid transport system ATPase component [Frankiales bacterium]|nr:ABC-type branched-chain amino acid transport system ATPase component [Frankiales bacterium]